MNLKAKLSFQFSLVVFSVLIFFSIVIYYFSYTSQLSKFRQSLLNRAQNTAILLINVQEVDSTLLKKMYQTTISLENEQIALTDSANNLIYGEEINNLPDIFSSADFLSSDPIYFTIQENDGVMYNHVVGNKRYHVFVVAYDKFRKENIYELRRILLYSVLCIVWLSVFASYWLSKFAMKPIADIISKMKEINSSKLSCRLDEGQQKDEIEQLACTFNKMLSELECAFKSQDEFVSNSSHELRTPLAVIIAESDYLLSKVRSVEEYQRHISNVTTDLRNLNQLLNSLLELAHLNKNNIVCKNVLRIDEPIFNAIQIVKAKQKERKVILKINYTEKEDDFIINGNPGLLEIAFKNLIDNAFKFSSEDVELTLSRIQDKIVVSIKDYGVGIPVEELDTIFDSFKRGTNVKFISGFGLGLGIVKKITDLHGATISVNSSLNNGSEFILFFNRDESIE